MIIRFDDRIILMINIIIVKVILKIRDNKTDVNNNNNYFKVSQQYFNT